MREKNKLDIEKIVNLYYEKEMSLDNIGKIEGYSGRSIANKLTENGYKIKNKNGKIGESFYLNDNFFNEWSHDMAYILGYATADAGIRSKKYEVKFKSIDLELLEFVQKSLNTNYQIKKEKNSNCYVLVLYSKKLVESLYNLGLMDRKSLIVKLNKQVPDQYFWSYLRGLVDGDGYVGFGPAGSKQIRLQLTSNFDFLQALNRVLIEKISCPEYNLNPQGKAYCLGIYGISAYKALKNMYINDHYALSRKKHAAETAISIFEQTINCDRCKKVIEFPHHNRRMCHECSKEAARECRRTYRRKKLN